MPRDQVRLGMDLIDGKHTQLLALFSNPSGPTKLKLDVSLQPLKFGQEMKLSLIHI